MKPAVFVLQGSGYIALPVTLALLRRGVPAYYIICREDDDLSRFLKRKKQYIIDFNDIEKTRKVIDGSSGPVIVYATDDVSLMFSQRIYELNDEKVHVPGWIGDVPPWHLIHKTNLLSLLKERLSNCNLLGILPETYIVNKNNYRELRLSNFPYIIKPAVKDIAFSFVKKYGAKIVSCEDRESISKFFKDADEMSTYLVQSQINESFSDEYCWWGMRAGGRLKRFVGKVLLKFPKIGGSAIYTTVIDPEELPEVVSYGDAILNELNFMGITELEFMKDREGNYKFIIEVNPRCWLQISNLIQFGYDLPYAYYCQLHGYRYDGDSVRNSEERRMWTNSVYFWLIRRNIKKSSSYILRSDPYFCAAPLSIKLKHLARIVRSKWDGPQ